VITIKRIEAALLKVAALIERDPAFSPIFVRLEDELESARVAQSGMTDAQRRAARYLQSANARSKRATCSSAAPLP